jgi:uncharacterized protein YndB with AHSA1/START domain
MSTRQTMSVSVTHRYDASPERVFDAWLDPVMIGRWMFGPLIRDEEVESISLDPKVGGSFSFVVRRQGERIDQVGEYLEIDRPRRLVFTWGVAQEGKPDMSRVTVGIAPSGEGAELTLTHELHPDWADFAERTRQGWTTMLDSLAKQLGA